MFSGRAYSLAYPLAYHLANVQVLINALLNGLTFPTYYYIGLHLMY